MANPEVRPMQTIRTELPRSARRSGIASQKRLSEAKQSGQNRTRRGIHQTPSSRTIKRADCVWCHGPLYGRSDRLYCSNTCKKAARRGKVPRQVVDPDVHRVFLAIRDGWSRKRLAELWEPSNPERAEHAVRFLQREALIYGGGWGVVGRGALESPQRGLKQGDGAAKGIVISASVPCLATDSEALLTV